MKKTKSSTRAMPDVSSEVSMASSQRKIPKGWVIVLVLVLLLVGLLATNKGLLVAAVVNGKPIFSWELTKTLKDRFGTQTLEGMIGERLVFEEAAKQGIAVRNEEIAAKRQEVVMSVGGDAQFADLLTFQGMTEEDFENQIRLQLLVQKLLGKDVEVTEEEIDVYVRDNAAVLTATDAAAMRAEARNLLIDQKVGEKIQPWFQEIKDNAQIMRFL